MLSNFLEFVFVGHSEAIVQTLKVLSLHLITLNELLVLFLAVLCLSGLNFEEIVAQLFCADQIRLHCNYLVDRGQLIDQRFLARLEL